jgi:hypothetical protein
VTPFGPWVLPGRYTVRLTANGETYEQPLTVKMDPRVKTPTAELERQHRLSMKLYALIQEDFAALTAVRAFRADRRNASRDDDAATIESSLARLNGSLGSLFRTVENADLAPTSQVVEAIGTVERGLAEAVARWEAFRARRE